MDRVVGLEGARLEYALVETPDGNGRLELVKATSLGCSETRPAETACNCRESPGDEMPARDRDLPALGRRGQAPAGAAARGRVRALAGDLLERDQAALAAATTSSVRGVIALGLEPAQLTGSPPRTSRRAPISSTVQMPSAAPAGRVACEPARERPPARVSAQNPDAAVPQLVLCARLDADRVRRAARRDGGIYDVHVRDDRHLSVPSTRRANLGRGHLHLLCPAS